MIVLDVWNWFELLLTIYFFRIYESALSTRTHLFWLREIMDINRLTAYFHYNLFGAFILTEPLSELFASAICSVLSIFVPQPQWCDAPIQNSKSFAKSGFCF